MEQLSLFNNYDELCCTIDKQQPKSFIKNPNSIILTSTVTKDVYTEYIQEHFDLRIEDTCEVEIPNNIHFPSLGDWSIGVVCGASGSGKSTILKHINDGEIKNAFFDCSKSLISNFDNLTPKDATLLLSSMGLASVPAWIRPYNVLSNGEKYRAELAKIVSESSENEIILIDDYTSVVDRNVAKSMSHALQKYIRKHNKKIILATCHYDIFEWLQPDWIYDLNKGGVLEKCDYLRQGKPKIELQVYRTTCDTWERFKKHHYMTDELNKACMCFCFTWDNKLVSFYSILPLPSGTLKDAYRGHRLVVLPDFQGLGLGSKICEFIGGVLTANGKSLYVKTVNPALGEYREKSKNWSGTPRNRQGMNECDFAMNIMGGKTRVSYCHKYIGGAIEGYDELLTSIDKLRHDKQFENQLTLF